MAFQPFPTKTPVDVGNIIVHLKDAVEGEEAPYRSAHAQVRVLYDDGSAEIWRGDLWPHLNATAQQALLDFATYLRNLAETEMVP